MGQKIFQLPPPSLYIQRFNARTQNIFFSSVHCTQHAKTNTVHTASLCNICLNISTEFAQTYIKYVNMLNQHIHKSCTSSLKSAVSPYLGRHSPTKFLSIQAAHGFGLWQMPKKHVFPAFLSGSEIIEKKNKTPTHRMKKNGAPDLMIDESFMFFQKKTLLKNLRSQCHFLGCRQTFQVLVEANVSLE